MYSNKPHSTEANAYYGLDYLLQNQHESYIKSSRACIVAMHISHLNLTGQTKSYGHTVIKNQCCNPLLVLIKDGITISDDHAQANELNNNFTLIR